MRQFGTDAHEVADDRLEHGTRRFDRDMQAVRAEAFRQLDHTRRDHGLAAGQHDMARVLVFIDPRENVVQRKLVAFRLPRRIRRIAPDAAQVAAAGAYEYGRHAHQRTLALYGVENLCDSHGRIGSDMPASSKPFRRRRQESHAPCSAGSA